MENTLILRDSLTPENIEVNIDREKEVNFFVKVGLSRSRKFLPN